MQLRTVTLRDGTTAYIEVRETATAEAQLFRRNKEKVIEKAVESLSDLGQIAMTYAAEVYEGVDELLDRVSPSKLALEFSLGVEGEVGIPFVAAGRANAALVVRLEWERPTGASSKRR